MNGSFAGSKPVGPLFKLRGAGLQSHTQIHDGARVPPQPVIPSARPYSTDVTTNLIAAPEQHPKLLVLELWGLGDLALASPFLQAASEKFQVTLLAKPVANDLQQRLWPSVKVIPFVAPWTAFVRKYFLTGWPWRSIASTVRILRAEKFDYAVSGRWDPRDHALMALTAARQTIGFGRRGSGNLLTRDLRHPPSLRHRADDWAALATVLKLEPPPALSQRIAVRSPRVLLHTGAAQPVRVWPLDRYFEMVQWLRARGCLVTVACDSVQKSWWLEHLEQDVVSPTGIAHLLSLADQSDLFIGNDSGPGHVAAACGVPTFTIFGNNLPELFAPQHPDSRWVKGKPCVYKPCFDECKFPAPYCIEELPFEEVLHELDGFLHAQITLPQK